MTHYEDEVLAGIAAQLTDIQKRLANLSRLRERQLSIQNDGDVDLSPADAAKLLGVSKQRVLALLHERRIAAVQDPKGRWTIRLSDLAIFEPRRPGPRTA